MEARNPNQDKGHIYRTVRCDVEDASAEAHEDELEALFDTFGKALAAYLELMPVRAPYRTAFRPEDYKAVKIYTKAVMHGERAVGDQAVEALERRGVFELDNGLIKKKGAAGMKEGDDAVELRYQIGRTMPVALLIYSVASMVGGMMVG
jgi:hypothetical protein